LGHVTSYGRVILLTAAILNHLPPKKKQLWQYLGTCNYQHGIRVNYSTSVKPLLSLLKLWTKCKCVVY